jgi:hypothetical protein
MRVTLRATFLMLFALATPVAADDRCAEPPAARTGKARHTRSKLIVRTGAPNHRLADLIARETDTVQRIGGKLAYGTIDKDLQGEVAAVYACESGAWRLLASGLTNDDGRFEVVLEGKARVPVGMRDLYVASTIDSTGAWGVAYVAPKDAKLVVTDIDGTLSESEDAVIGQMVKGTDIAHRPYAPEALSKVPHVIVYVSSRGDVFTEKTRAWLTSHGFPRGLIRLGRGVFVPSGDRSVEYKTAVMRAITVPIAAGIGNRASDIAAYARARIPANRILIHLPEFEQEVEADLAASRAVGFTDYQKLAALVNP